jgi:hypothetical protein
MGKRRFSGPRGSASKRDISYPSVLEKPKGTVLGQLKQVREKDSTINRKKDVFSLI